MNDEFEYPSEAQQIAALVAGTGEMKMVACTKQISYRAPVHVLAKVDALAAQAGKSRAAMLTLLLGAGLEEVMKQLPRKVLKELQLKESDALRELGTGDGSGEVA